MNWLLKTKLNTTTGYLFSVFPDAFSASRSVTREDSPGQDSNFKSWRSSDLNLTGPCQFRYDGSRWLSIVPIQAIPYHCHLSSWTSSHSLLCIPIAFTYPRVSGNGPELEGFVLWYDLVTWCWIEKTRRYNDCTWQDADIAGSFLMFRCLVLTSFHVFAFVTALCFCYCFVAV